MAYPVILVDSTDANKSDTACSGAGPSTAKTGSAASVGGTATSVSITDAVDLSGVATDGSACLYYADTTAGHRRFDRITGISGSSGAWTVTVANGYTTSTGPFSWAIGGVRATIAGSVSLLLFNNNTAAGDAMPGWVVEMKSGHTETVTTNFDLRRSGSTSNGPIILRGASGAATVPVITFSNNGSAFIYRSSGVLLRDFEIQNSNATKTASTALSAGSGSQLWAIRLKISNSTNKFWKGITSSNSNSSQYNRIINCEIGYTASNSIEVSVSTDVLGCYIHDGGATGIAISGTSGASNISDNIIVNHTGDGINSSYNGSSLSGSTTFRNNTIDNNGGDGIEITSADARSSNLQIIDNQITNNGGYGVNFSSGSATDNLIAYYGCEIFNNNTYNNTSGAYKSATSGYTYNTCPWASGDPGLNPSYTGGGNYTPTNTSLAGTAYPTSVP